MKIKTAEFVTSIADARGLDGLELPEFAFVGRSNVGKSSLINSLCNQKKLAKASSTPGRTRLINVFEINKQFYFIDLPGYGYHQASKSDQQKWQQLIGQYFENSVNLRRVFVLVDIRHAPSELDCQMLRFLYAYNLPFCVVATKADKISRGQIARQVGLIASTLGIGTADIVVTSSVDRSGHDAICDTIDSALSH